MILVSDYDRTLKINDEITDFDRMMIEKFESLGHLFCVNSGRSVQHLHQNFEIHQFHAQYTICGSGSQIYDSNKKMIYQDCMKESVVKPLIQKIIASEAITYQITSNKEWIHSRRDSNNWLEILNIHDFKEVNSVSCKFETVELAEKFCNEIRDEFEVSPYQNGFNIDIAPIGVSKATGIKRLNEVLKLNTSEIYTIGDSLNDIEMIQEFDGFCVEKSHPKIIEISKKIFESVGECIEYLLKIEQR